MPRFLWATMRTGPKGASAFGIRPPPAPELGGPLSGAMPTVAL